MRDGVAEDYTYIVARLRAVEAALPEKAWFERLSRAGEENLLGSLREHFRAFEGVGELLDFERALAEERSAALDLVSSLLPGERPRLLVRAGHDFDNVRHAWKASKLGREATALTSFGLVPAATVAETFAGKLRGAFPPHLAALVEELDASYEASKSLAAAEYAGETAKWRFLFSVAPDERAAEYLRVKIDLANVQSFVRLRLEPIRGEALSSVWIAGGEIAPDRYEGLFAEPLDEFFAYLATTSYRSLPAAGLAKDAPLWRVDALLRRAVLELLGGSRYRHFDISPVLYHVELRERNEEVLRRIITGKLNRMNEEMLLERVEALLAA
jgi:vacuolar-type H+-ATPase subunit C/Vma6